MELLGIAGWYFFPVVLAVRTPLPVLLLFAVWGGAAAVRVSADVDAVPSRAEEYSNTPPCIRAAMDIA